MVKLRTYGQVVASPGGRSFYSNPRKRTRRVRAPVTPALREVLRRQWEEHRAEYRLALKDARDTIDQYAAQLRETFGGHSAEYYAHEILQRGQLERSRRKPSQWNAYLCQELKARNAGTEMVTSYVAIANTSLAQHYLPDNQNSSQTMSLKKLPRSGRRWTRRQRL